MLLIAAGQPPARDTYADPARPSAGEQQAASAEASAQDTASRRAKKRATLKSDGFHDAVDHVYLRLKGRAPTKGSRKVVLQGRPAQADGVSSTWTTISANGTPKTGRYTLYSRWTMDAEYRVVLPKWNGKRRATSRPIEVLFRPGGPLAGDLEAVPGVAAAYEATMSDDGSVVVFTVAREGDRSIVRDLYRYDARTGRTVKLRPPVNGDVDKFGFESLQLSSTGRWMAFAVMVPASEPGSYEDGGVMLYDHHAGTYRVVESDEADLTSFTPTDMSAQAELLVGKMWLPHGGGRASVVVDLGSGHIDVLGRRSDGTVAFTYDALISDDGRYVFFNSYEPGIVPGDDQEDTDDGFRHDRLTGETTLVSVDSQGEPLPQGGGVMSITGDGRFLVLEDLSDLYTPRVFDAETGRSAEVPVAWAGLPDAIEGFSGLSGDGTRAISGACDGDASQAFLADLESGEATRLTTDARGRPANGTSGPVQISGDGRTVLIRGNATNLADGPSPTGLFLWRERVED